MKKFILLYISPVSAEEQMKDRSPEEVQKAMTPWVEWFGKLGDAVTIKGVPLGNSHVLGGSAKTGVSGYSEIQAESMEAALEMCKDHPNLQIPGMSIEILEYLPVPGM